MDDTTPESQQPNTATEEQKKEGQPDQKVKSKRKYRRVNLDERVFRKLHSLKWSGHFPSINALLLVYLGILSPKEMLCERYHWRKEEVNQDDTRQNVFENAGKVD